MCLRKVRSMKVQDLQLEYGFPDLNTATALRNRWVAGCGVGQNVGRGEGEQGEGGDGGKGKGGEGGLQHEGVACS